MTPVSAERSGLVPRPICPYGWDVARRRGVVGFEALRHIDPFTAPDRFRRRAQSGWLVVVPVDGVSADDEFVADCARASGTPVVEPHRREALLTDREAWQHESFQQWGSALDRRRVEPDWEVAGRPRVTITLATRRPEFVDAWTAMIARQTHRPLQVVVAMHGPQFTAVHQSRMRDELNSAGIDVVTVTVDDSEVLGGVLQAALLRADGDVIVKWDDDDLYSTSHVHDLLRTRHYSGATIVGKACDFVYLQHDDRTVRRRQTPREMFSPTLAGGTLAIGRDDLLAVGGWDLVANEEDKALIDKIRRFGGTSYRSVGFGYMMIRRADTRSHTWQGAEVAIAASASQSRPGLDVAWAMIDQPASVIERVVRDADGGPRN